MSTGIVIVQQQERMVIQRFGRFDKVVGPGFRFLVPIIFNGTKVGIWERTQRVPTQKYITTDNVVVDLDFVIYYQVLPDDDNPRKAVLDVQSFEAAVVNLAVAELRSIIGNISLADALAERERIQGRLQMALDENTGRWGVKVRNVAINEIDPPPGVKQAMEREKSAAAIKTAEITESEGQRQAQINRAEGEKESAILQAEGNRQAAILEAEGDQQATVLRAQGFSSALEQIYNVANNVDAKTMSLQYFDTLKSLGSSPSTKFIFPMEFTSMLSPFLGMGGNQQSGNGGNNENSQT
ncbi:MAG: SPFH/Band 7/PHB domain protein [Chloroflexota bacterium]|nr:SPFH/Band 7/PHB domain protein [Chloroflexota bacterium]